MSSAHDPAFPVPAQVMSEGVVTIEHTHYGMTLRQWYAGQALIGVLSNRTAASLLQLSGPHKVAEQRTVCEIAFEVADAMIAETKPQGD